VNDALQFEKAEYDQPLTCAACQHEIARVYHEMNGRLFCDRCRRKTEIAINSGSRFTRAMRAILAGSGAAIVGALVYFGVTKLTGYELSLMTILIGYVVGTAVRWGSNGRGGLAYQALAVVLTYVAIVSTYAPAVVEAMADADRRQIAEPATPAVSPGPPGPATVAAPTPAPKSSLARFAAIVAVVSVIVCIAPFMLGVKNAIGLVIIGVGLYQAWKVNRRLMLNFSGPHRIRAPEPAPDPVV
jgi:hypothetical protein